MQKTDADGYHIIIAMTTSGDEFGITEPGKVALRNAINNVLSVRSRQYISYFDDLIIGKGANGINARCKAVPRNTIVGMDRRRDITSQMVAAMIMRMTTGVIYNQTAFEALETVVQAIAGSYNVSVKLSGNKNIIDVQEAVGAFCTVINVHRDHMHVGCSNVCATCKNKKLLYVHGDCALFTHVDVAIHAWSDYVGHQQSGAYLRYIRENACVRASYTIPRPRSVDSSAAVDAGLRDVASNEPVHVPITIVDEVIETPSHSKSVSAPTASPSAQGSADSRAAIALRQALSQFSLQLRAQRAEVTKSNLGCEATSVVTQPKSEQKPLDVTVDSPIATPVISQTTTSTHAGAKRALSAMQPDERHPNTRRIKRKPIYDCAYEKANAGDK